MKEKDAARRARENAALLARFRAGETLSLVEPAATWWPPRPIVKKDVAEMARAHNTTPAHIAADALAKRKGEG